MLIGYARTSTLDQIAGVDAQARDLARAGCERIFTETASARGPRAELERALAFLREGDVLLVVALDRLARSVPDLCAIVARLEGKGAALRILAMNVDTATPSGRLMLNLLGAIAQFEREVMLERQREGVARAKLEGKYKGRAPTARAKAAEIRALAAQGLTRRAVAARLGIGVASVYRVLKADGAGPGAAGLGAKSAVDTTPNAMLGDRESARNWKR